MYSFGGAERFGQFLLNLLAKVKKACLWNENWKKSL